MRNNFWGIKNCDYAAPKFQNFSAAPRRAARGTARHRVPRAGSQLCFQFEFFDSYIKYLVEFIQSCDPARGTWCRAVPRAARRGAAEKF